jgi:transposase-like protein
VASFGVRTNRYDAAFKQEVVEEFIRGDKRGAQIARERAIDYQTLRKWRLEYDQHGADVWSKATVTLPTNESKIAELERVIGQQTLEILVLKKALTLARSASKLSTNSSTR